MLVAKSKLSLNKGLLRKNMEIPSSVSKKLILLVLVYMGLYTNTSVSFVESTGNFVSFSSLPPLSFFGRTDAGIINILLWVSAGYDTSSFLLSTADTLPLSTARNELSWLRSWSL